MESKELSKEECLVLSKIRDMGPFDELTLKKQAGKIVLIEVLHKEKIPTML